MKLLLVDDDAFLRDMYAAKFEEAGHKVAVAKDGHAALALLESGESFDVVVLDMVMPGITGVDLLKHITRMQGGESMKCIVLSNQGEQQDIDSAKAAGAVGYIIKAESIPSEVVAKVTALASE